MGKSEGASSDSSGDSEAELLVAGESAERDIQAVLKDPIPEGFQGLGENIYALAIATLVRDYVALTTGTTAVGVRTARMFMSGLGIVILLLGQAYLLHAVYSLLCAPAVHHVRKDYSNYQLHMYGKEHTYVNDHGSYRGVGSEFFDSSKFQSLPASLKDSVCTIPLAHPYYSFAILYIWTLTCIADLRTVLVQTVSVLWGTPTVKISRATDVLELQDDGSTVNIVGLSITLKAILGCFCLFPRFLAIGLLNFLGCRWLLATESLSDLLLNGLALEFILLLKDLLYMTLASERNKKVTESTQIKSDMYGQLSVLTNVTGLLWCSLGAAWVYLYMAHFQQVLPGYMWDVKKACMENGAYNS